MRCGCACPAWAVLGQGVASVASDQQRLKGQLRSAAAEGFSVHEITAADGSLVREYVSPAGEVFGVAWRGPAVTPSCRRVWQKPQSF